MRRSFVLALIVTSTVCQLPARASTVHNPQAPGFDAAESNPITVALRAAFTARNPAITRVKVLELRSTQMAAGPYILLGWGIRADLRFEGRFDDELFGVFRVDNDLTRIERTLDVFPTQRWADYVVFIEKLTDTEVTVVGHGSYGDQRLRRVYRYQ